MCIGSSLNATEFENAGHNMIMLLQELLDAFFVALERTPALLVMVLNSI
jgi:hypothetical protein